MSFSADFQKRRLAQHSATTRILLSTFSRNLAIQCRMLMAELLDYKKHDPTAYSVKNIGGMLVFSGKPE